MAFLKSAPAENFGALLAAIWMRSPVCGFTPWRAPRSATENLPKPVIATSPPRCSVSLTTSVSAFTAASASDRLMSARSATCSISSDLFKSSLRNWFLGQRVNLTAATDAVRADFPLVMRDTSEKPLFAGFQARNRVRTGGKYGPVGGENPVPVRTPGPRQEPETCISAIRTGADRTLPPKGTQRPGPP